MSEAVAITFDTPLTKYRSTFVYAFKKKHSHKLRKECYQVEVDKGNDIANDYNLYVADRDSIYYCIRNVLLFAIESIVKNNGIPDELPEV